MSTRCTIHFEQYDETMAIIYRHGDGYPETVMPDLAKFFAAVEAQTKDTQFDDASYLAAKFVVWQAGRYALRGAPLAFLGVAPVMGDPGDVDYRYHVVCSGSDRPAITYEDAGTVTARKDPLLAAAPDLIAELSLIVDGWARKGRDLTMWEAERLEFAMVALAKAKGGAA